MNTKKCRPAAQKSANVNLFHRPPQHQEIFPLDKVQSTKSVPDLLDSKYLECRRPWYLNPDYKGPKNITNTDQKNYSTSYTSNNALETVNKLKASIEEIFSNENKRKDSNYRKTATESSLNHNSEALQNGPYYSYDNLLDTNSQLLSYENDKYHDSLNLSSSPESVFSMLSSSISSFGKPNQMDLIPIPNQNTNPTKTFKNNSPRKVQKIRLPYSLMSTKTSINKSGQIYFPEPLSRHLQISDMKNSCGNRISLWSAGSYQDFTGQSNCPESSNVSSISSKTSMKSSIISFPNSNHTENELRKKQIFPLYSSQLTSTTEINILSKSDSSLFDQVQFQVLLKTFSYLEVKSLIKCSEVCKLWYAVSKHPLLWKKIKIKNAKISFNAFKILNQWSKNVVEISLENISLIDKPDSQRFISNTGSNLEEFIKNNKASLKVLRIVNCDKLINGKIFWTISIHCSTLTKLIYLSNTYPLGQEELFPLGKGCPRIISLIIPPGWPCCDPTKFNDACCETVAKCWPKLQVLCIGGRILTLTGLGHIAKGCLKLQQLEIDHGPEITEDITNNLISYGLRGLESLDFTFTPVSPRAVVLFNNACPRLEHIGIHCNISDYFSDPNSSKAKANFSSLKTLFKRLKSRSGFSRVLDIDLDYNLD